MKRLTSILVALAVAATATAAQAGADPDDLNDLDALDSATQSSATSWLQVRQLKGFLAQQLRSYPVDRGLGKHDEQALFETRAELSVGLGSWARAVVVERLLVDALDTTLHRYEPLEAYVAATSARWDVRLGQLADGLGMADAFNPLDVLNRRDLPANLLDPPRLGELGGRVRLQLGRVGPIGDLSVTAYALPVWRSTPLFSEDSRLALSQGPMTLRENMAAEPNGIDEVTVAARVDHTLTTRWFNADLQYVAASGPDRTPAFEARPRADGGVDLAPVYFGLYTAGVGVRAVPNIAWWSKLTFKAEVAYKRPYRLEPGMLMVPEAHVQYAVGVDRSFTAPFRRKDELMVIIEYLGEHGANDPVARLRPFRNDIATRLLWRAGDFARSQIEARGIVDVRSGELVAELALRRQARFIHDDLRIELAGRWFRPDRDTPSMFGWWQINNSSVRIRLQYDF